MRRVINVLTTFLLLFSCFGGFRAHAETVKPNTKGLSAIQVEKGKGKANGTDKKLTKAPRIKSVTVNKKAAAPGDKVTIAIAPADDKVGISEISLDLLNANGDKMVGEAFLNETTGKFEASFDITAKTSPGKWSIHGIYVIDMKDNYAFHYNGRDGNDFGAADFIVK